MMSLLYVGNLLLWLFLTLLPPIYFSIYFRLGTLNLLTIYALFTIPPEIVTTLSGPLFLLKDGLFNPYFQYALLVQNVHDGLAFLMLTLLVRLLSAQPFRGYLERLMRSGGLAARPKRMRLAADLFFALFCLCFVLLARHSYGVVPWILNPRMGYQFHRAGAGQWYALCITFLSLATVLGTVYTTSSTSLFKRLPLYLFGVYLLGSKDYILLYTAYFLTILSLRKFRYFRATFFLLVLISIALFAYIFISSMHGLGIEQIATYSDYFVNAAMYYQRYLNGQIPLYHGEIFLSSFWRIVPRALYPNKPYSYGITLINDIFYPGQASKGFTPAFATVSYFADFGWIGVVLSGLLSPTNVLTALLYVMVLPRLPYLDLTRTQQSPRMLLYAFLLIAAPAFLTFFDFPLDVLFFGFIVGIVEIICRLRILYRHPTGRENIIPSSLPATGDTPC
ncbi:hypothetical protein CWRG_02399 [Chthonomonas calidirosea]|uniref:hypothetical protein n=1 Tax=Chthonomonas calidirosea TaxID=454171 RepID=UPI0006DD40E1|nr:hypothetical protein [Chthonomonas calidirosea]CEK19126.1 hypothetical protein CWRG_02399 [Chthonomonas calidirosea]CEK19136.1 hypothetical protein CP488_02418 [Chthonomonas calidirosea]